MNFDPEDSLYYYCNDGATVEGPTSWETILELFDAGVVSRDTSVCAAGSDEWFTFASCFPAEKQSADEIPAEFPEEPPPALVSAGPGARRGAVSAFLKRRGVLAGLSCLLLAVAAFFGARLFQRDGAVDDSAKAVDVVSTAAEAGNERWVWAIEPRYDEALPFEPFGVAPVRLGRKWGLIDRTGRELLPCAYDEIEVFPKEECVAVRKGSGWGLVDAQGKLLVEPVWEAVQQFVNGFIPVKKDGKWGYTDASGKLVIPCTWDDVWRFSAAGTAVVTKETGEGRKRGYIDKSGRDITAPEWDGAQTPSAEGLGAVRRGNGWALVDKNGKVLGEPQWEMQWRLLRPDLGFLPVCRGGKWGLIALDGTVLVEPAWDWVAPAEKGVLLSRPGTQSIFVGAKGKTIFESGPWDEVRGLQSPSDYQQLKAPGFVEGFLAVRSGDKWGFIDDKGKTVIPATWDNVGAFSEGLVAASNKNKGDGWRFLTPDGLPAFANPDGVRIGDDRRAPRFRNGKVAARGAGYSKVSVDRNGKVVGDWSDNSWLPEDVTIKGIKFDYVSRYGRYGYMRDFADKDGKTFMRDVPYPMSADPFPYPGPPRYGLASASGKVLVEPAWDCAEVISPDWVRIWVGGRQGLVNAKGEQILGPEWERVEVAGNGLLLATDGDRKFVFDRTGKALLPADLDGAEYVDFYGDGFMVRSENADGSSLWSLCDPSAPDLVSFKNASRVYWNGDLVKSGLLWIEERDSGRWSLVKRDGSALGVSQITQPVKWLMPEGFGVLSKEDGTKIHVGVDGQTLGDKSWEDALLFSQGLAPVKSEGKWGFIDTEGKMVIQPAWDEASDFRNIGTEENPMLLARVVREGRWGCIDPSGREVIEPQWDEMMVFTPLHDGRFVALVRLGEFWGCIDPTGKTIVEPCGTRGMVEGGFVMLVVKKEGEEYGNFVYFDANGVELDWQARQAIEAERQKLADVLGEGTLVTEASNRKFGLKDSSGKFVLPPKWNHIAWIGPGTAAAWNHVEGGIFDTTGKELFKDDTKRRLARFDRPYRTYTPGRYQKGLVVIEATPVWGYAKLEPIVESTEAEPAATEAVAPVLINAQDTASMRSKVGSEVIVEGVVKGVGKGPNDGITFLNFGERKSGFVAVIFRSSYEKFPEGFDQYSNQKVRVKGSLENYRDRQMQIRISTPDQLEILASEP